MFLKSICRSSLFTLDKILSFFAVLVKIGPKAKRPEYGGRKEDNTGVREGKGEENMPKRTLYSPILAEGLKFRHVRI